MGAAADVAERRRDHVRGPNQSYALPLRRLLCPRPSLAIPMVASHPLDFPFPFSILLRPCLKGPLLPRAEQRPEVCTVNLPFQDHSDPYTHHLRINAG
jgi:hypothetical protein